ncbi:anti-virulence regulator CigR family protein [Bordetella bronchiseptica]|uniref:anti-virulence regulator CigR family protein n=1 Tax=Bordetella bronchiseptica TaxID=518 RepID=UPI0005282408|nr:anti-virulence regulator CigR family protein [Bordetella bronchiseptica]
MKRSSVTAVLVCVLSLALAAPAWAAPPEGKGNSGQGNSGKSNNGKSNNGNGNGKGNSGNSGNSGKRSGDGGVSIELRHAGITISTARGYAVEYGVTGYGSLPPGIRKNLARGKPLPPGIAKKAVPPSMLARLPVYPGYEWRVAGSDLVLVALAGAVVADVLLDVFR